MANPSKPTAPQWAMALAATMVLIAFGQAWGQSLPTPQVPGGVAAAAHPYPRRVPAPPLDGDFEWLNTTKPIALEDLRGKFVLIDFWTFCCINCMHVLPELKKLEQTYPHELVVIGVHSAKFASEQETGNIREAVLRYEIAHPVVNDSKLTLWNRYGIQSWPTLVLIDPAGEAVWVGNGERKFEDVKAIIDRGLPYYGALGMLNPAPLPFIDVPDPPPTPLRFPGKVLADEAGNRLFIADSNHNRIVITDLAGKLRLVIGSGEIGRADGRFEVCSFHHPQGMVLVGDKLIVADTENHLLRQVDFSGKRVTTIAGTGEQGGLSGPLPNGRFAGPPLSMPLNSPWALWNHDTTLYIAMAGAHQIWSMQLDRLRIGPYAGSGREDIEDGRLLPKRPYVNGYAAFAQPSGLASDDEQLFVADSEGSAIRRVPFEASPLSPAGKVTTLVGVIGSLFEFGDVDGVGSRVRLQHPLGIVYHAGKLYIADTYNNKVKALDLASGRCETMAGTGKVGSDDAANGMDASFNEPGGIAVAGEKLFVADTNNHAIRVIELAPPNRVTTLAIEGLTTTQNSLGGD